MSKAATYLAVASAIVASIVVYEGTAFGQGRGEGRQGGQAARPVYPEAPPIGFIGSYRIAPEKTDPSKLPILGAWRINFEKSDPSFKAQGRFKETGTTIYTAVDGGMKTETFLFYPPKDDSYKTTFTDDGREYWFKLDGQNIYKDPQGPNGLGQTVAMWLVDRNSLYRERATKGVIDERVMYRVTPDGRSLVWTNFSGGPAESGHLVWDRIELPRR